MPDVFGPISPNPAADTFVFDFAQQIGPVGTIVSAVWQCSVDPSSPVPDSVPMARILNPPAFSNTATSALIGNMIEGCLYLLQTQVTIDDQRVLVDTAKLECRTPELEVIQDDVLTSDEFRAMFPGFDSPIYSDVTIQFWINQAVALPVLNAERWGQFYNMGICLWVAHILTINAVMSSRRTPQFGSGVPSSKSVGGVSVSYDNSLGVEKDAGWYALTPYGNAFLRYMRLAGSAPVHLVGPDLFSYGQRTW